MNATTFNPPEIISILNRREVECLTTDGQTLIVWEEEAMDVLDQLWLLVVCECEGGREVSSWVYLGRET